MKKIALFLTPILLTASSEFKYIKPISVEKAPVIVEKKVKKEEVVKEDSEDLLEELPDDLEDNLEDELPVEDSNKEEAVVIFDEDNDGVLDKDDKCPNTLEGFKVDKFGCPQTATLHVTFPPDEYKVTQDVLDDVKKFAEFLKENPGYQVIIYGHTDSRGSAEDNKILSQKRADSVKEALIEHGISETRLTAIGMGEEHPIADNTFKAGRQKNRRIEVELIK